MERIAMAKIEDLEDNIRTDWDKEKALKDKVAQTRDGRFVKNLEEVFILTGEERHKILVGDLATKKGDKSFVETGWFEDGTGLKREDDLVNLNQQKKQVTKEV